MDFEKHDVYKRFISHLKVLEQRENEKVNKTKDEQAKRKAEEYRNIYMKLEKIRVRKEFSLAKNEENEDKKLYEEISEMLYNECKEIGLTSIQSAYEKIELLFSKIKGMLIDYKIERESFGREKNNEGIEK